MSDVGRDCWGARATLLLHVNMQRKLKPGTSVGGSCLGGKRGMFDAKYKLGGLAHRLSRALVFDGGCMAGLNDISPVEFTTGGTTKVKMFVSYSPAAAL